MIGPDGLATGVSYVDRNTLADMRANARVVVLAASALETARLLLGGFAPTDSNVDGAKRGILGQGHS